MGVTWYVADWMTALLRPVRLPLTVRRASYSLQGGTFDADLDLRDSTLSAADREAMWDVVAPHTSSVVAVREDLTQGEGAPVTDRVMGEWRITRRHGSYRSGVVSLSGHCAPSYLKELMFAQNWRYAQVDPAYRIQLAITNAFYSGQGNSAEGYGVNFLPGPDATSPKRVPVNWTAGSLTYWDAVSEFAEAGFEWTLEPGLTSESGVPTRVRRALRIQDPVLRTPRDGIVFRAGPGRVIQDFTYETEAAPNDMWVLGAGSGESQWVGRHEYDRPTGVSRISHTVTASDLVTQAAVDARAKALLDAAQVDDQVFTATADMALLPGGGPRIGYSHPWQIDPSLSLPYGEEGRVRVVGWDWSTPAPGARETVQLQLVKE
jgi:hypothetical protein